MAERDRGRGIGPWPPGTSELAKLIRMHDWASTPLGPIETWPQSLRVSVRLMLQSRQPQFIWWGPELVLLYNDAYAEFLGSERHPQALGARAPAVWRGIWHLLAPHARPIAEGLVAAQTDDVMTSELRVIGQPWREAEYLAIDEPSAASGVGGVLGACHDAHEDALREREERLRLALAVGELATWDWDLRTGNIIWSDEHYRMQGYGVGEIAPSYEAWASRIHPEDRAEAEAAVIEARDQHKPYGHDFRAIHPDGSVHWLSARGHFFYDSEGNATRMIGAMRDVSDETNARLALAESAERLELALQAATLGTFVWYPESDWAEPDARMRAVLGLPQFGRLTLRATLEELVDPQDRRRYAAALAKAIDPSGSGRLSEDLRLLLPNGGERWFSLTGHTHFEGAVARRLAGVLVDISERKRAEAMLRASEERLRMAVAATALGIFDWDLVTDKVTVNERFREMLGLPTQEDVIGAAMMEHVVHPADRAYVGERIAAALDPRSNGSYEFEHRAVTPHGERWLLTFGQVQFAEEGGVRRAVRIFGNDLDITERKRSEQALRASEERQAFLLRLSDALGPLFEPELIRATAAKQLGDLLNVSRAVYVDLDGGRGALTATKRAEHVRDGEPLDGTLDLSRFGEPLIDGLLQGTTVLSDDVENDPRFSTAERQAYASIGVAAFVGVALVKEGRPVLAFGVTSQTPRAWTGLEVELVRDVAERTWAAAVRARVEAALRESEERQALLLELSDALRQVGDPLEIQAVTVRTLGAKLGAAWASYLEYDDPPLNVSVRREFSAFEQVSLAGLHRVRSALALHKLQSGETLVVEDLEASPIISEDSRTHLRSSGLRSLVCVPIVKEGKLLSALIVGHVTPRRWSDTQVALLRDAADRTWAAVERARAEALLRASEERFRTLVESVRDYAIFQLDPSGAVTSWTAGARRVTGYAAEQVIGRNAGLFYVDPEELKAELAEASLSGRAEREGWRMRKGGERFWVNEIATAVRDERGELRGFTKISRDLTEQRRLQQQREDLLTATMAANSEARLASRIKDEFLATLGHELRTPVAAILLWAGALRSGAVAIDDLERAVDAILQSAQNQSRLIDDLLDLSRLTSGKLLLSPAPVAVAEVVRGAADVIAPKAREKGVMLDVRASNDLGHAMLDAARVQQVLWNLLSNATKFTPPGGTVSLSARRADSWLELTVTDDGEGISREFMPFLFERFRQADMGETREHGGLGIGLALSKQLVELQGGSISAHSEGPDRGAVFQVRLPWRAATESEETYSSHAKLKTPVAPLEGVRVLLVEDDESTREVMRMTLSGAGAKVIPVCSGNDALSKLDELEREPDDGSPIVIVSDLGLPGMSGYELIERIVERARSKGAAQPPAGAVSAHARDVDRERALAAGFDLYLAKPVTTERLIEAVSDLRDIAVLPQFARAR